MVLFVELVEVLDDVLVEAMVAALEDVLVEVQAARKTFSIYIFIMAA